MGTKWIPAADSIRRVSSHQEALRLYKARIQSPPPDPFAAVFTLKACSASAGSGGAALVPHLHAHLLKTNLRSHVHVATVLLHVLSASSLSDARQLFDEMPHRNLVTTNTMLTCYSAHGHVPDARSLFDTMPHRDIVSWSAMIAGYIDNGDCPRGLELFRTMMGEERFMPDQRVLATLLSGCSYVGLLGRSVHAYVTRHGLGNRQLETSLVHMYAKSGCLKSAFWVFERITERNVVHWTVMICALAVHGHGEEAVDFFEGMMKEGVRPNDVTFTGVLNGCCHAGLVEEGERYFSTMVEEFGYEPSIHHYGCMVDLFAKAGRLREAHLVIQSMKVEPNVVVLTSFLSACNKHKDFEIAEGVIDRLLEMTISEEDGGVYTLVSNLYALAGRWNDVERVRRVMDQRNVRKNRGLSFVQGPRDRETQYR